MKNGYVYILSSHSRMLYRGVTSDLEGRVWEHKQAFEGFTKTYRINQLVYYEDYPDMLQAIAREKQLKGWTRAKKIAPCETKSRMGRFAPLVRSTQVLRLRLGKTAG